MQTRRLLLLLVPLVLSACASLVDRATAELGAQLTGGILDHDDPDTVASGLPAYLLLLDGLNHEAEAHPQRLCLAADLYSAYAGSFVADPLRAKRLSRRGFDYAVRAACTVDVDWCGIDKRRFEEVEQAIAQADEDEVDTLHCLGGAWAGYIQAHADDWNAIAAIPKARRVIERAVELDPGRRDGQGQLYLGVMNSLLPPAYGGKPELAQRYFEEALARSGGRNQMVRVMYARHYARLVFDRELHDRLLDEVLAADPRQPGLTLLNTLAQQQARLLRASAKDYFE
ncbi:MAG: hypothetical protein IT479_00595 [Xanthomonadales bacterium]|nr:hypothetical protein [Xanthomonadales bacterium]MCC6591751.1 hypothetical protein [Xanthomonadales bacterium]MCE7931159.1 hypothetical protein [Xanthomonadales bacterium PRO6]